VGRRVALWRRLFSWPGVDSRGTQKSPTRKRIGLNLQITSTAIPAAPLGHRQAVLLGVFRAIRDGVAAARNVLARTGDGVATGEHCTASDQKQSDESSHEFSPSE